MKIAIGRIGVGAIIAAATIGIAFTALISGSTSLSIQNYGSLKVRTANYTITNKNNVYAGTENISPYRTTSGSDAATVIGTVFGWLSSTTTQSVEFIGDFTLGSTVSLGKNAYLNFTRAIVTGTTTVPDAVVLNILSPAVVTIIGGYWTGALENTRIVFQSSAGNSIIDGMEAKDFKLELIAGCGPNMTVKNCDFHNSTNISYYLAINNQGHNTIKDCNFTGSNVANVEGEYPIVGGIFVAEWCPFNLIEGCVFDNMGYHSIYLDAAHDSPPQSMGTNIVRGCIFRNFKNQNMAGIHVKCPYNKFYSNVFEDFAPGWLPVAISCYSDYPYANANDNEIYNNSFTNMTEAIRVGASISDAPQSRNRIYNNTFTNISALDGCIALNYGTATYELSDTWIYYNKFLSCPTPFPPYTGARSLVHGTVIAYNEFGTTVPTDEVNVLKAYVNTLVYGNGAELADYPVPLPSILPIPPP